MFRGRKWLKPVSALYALILHLRRGLYDGGIIQSQQGKLPTIVIGNLSLGGTGKTPHAEYILNQLNKWCKPALLSRGYGRKTRGFILANKIKATASIVGDEPMQMHLKFPDLDVAVCENRLQGISHLKAHTNSNVVVLDDAFQHRRLQGDLNILLTRFDRPFWSDSLVPAGSLRDVVASASRADVIIVTKCPLSLTRAQQESIKKNIPQKPNRRIFFTALQYGAPYPLRHNDAALPAGSSIIGLAGLADDEPMRRHLGNEFKVVHFKSFSDHHTFSRSEIETLWSKYGTFAQAIVTTEKDAARLIEIQGLEKIPIFVLPISVSFISDESDFIQLLRST